MKGNKSDAQWSRLDNAAKVFPANSGKADTKVFRFACELYEPVEEDVLEEALELTLRFFPHYQSVLRHGLFWHYFESSDLEPQVHEENTRPCSPMYDGDSRRLLYEVTYYRNRINVEVYHALTDGTGALQFLRVLVFHYLVLLYGEAWQDDPPKMDYDATPAQKADDSFRKYYSGERSQYRSKLVRAYKIKGQRVAEHQIKVIEGLLSTKAALTKARELGTTVTVMLTAILMIAIAEEMTVREKRRPVVLSVPILFFVSLTAMIILTKVLLRGALSEQLVYLCINILLSFLPVISLALGVLRVRWPSIICVAAAVVALAAILLFMDRSLKRELRRRLHM